MSADDMLAGDTAALPGLGETPAIPSPPSAGPDGAAEGGKPKRTRKRTTKATTPTGRRPVPSGPSVTDKAPAGRGPGKPSNKQKREQRLGEQLAAIAMVVGVIHDDDGTAIARHAPPIAKSLATLAEENATVAKYLDGAMTGSAWLGVLIAVGGLAIEIAGNHGAVPAIGPAGDGGVVLPFPKPDFSNMSEAELAEMAAMAQKLMGDAAGSTPPGTDG